MRFYNHQHQYDCGILAHKIGGARSTTCSREAPSSRWTSSSRRSAESVGEPGRLIRAVGTEFVTDRGAPCARAPCAIGNQWSSSAFV